MFSSKTSKKGFTLIELLIVIAIIGVLAATVVVSLGSRTDDAKEKTAKLNIASIRNVATVAVVEGEGGANGICDEIYPDVSGEKTDWTWTDSGICKADDADDDGEICCSSTLANGTQKWALWTKLGTSNGANTGKVYCADSSGQVGEIALAPATGDGSEKPNNKTVKKGKGTGSSGSTVESCQ